EKGNLKVGRIDLRVGFRSIGSAFEWLACMRTLTRCAIGAFFALAFLAGCSGATSSLTPASSAAAAHKKHKDLLACSTIHTSDGHTFTAALLGGGNHLDIEATSYTNCDIGIYISAANGPASLDHTVVGGAFPIGVYLDSPGPARINQTSICVNGANSGGA